MLGLSRGKLFMPLRSRPHDVETTGRGKRSGRRGGMPLSPGGFDTLATDLTGDCVVDDGYSKTKARFLEKFALQWHTRTSRTAAERKQNCPPRNEEKLKAKGG